MPDDRPTFSIPTPLGKCDSCGKEITGAGHVSIDPTGRRVAYHEECRSENQMTPHP